MSTLNFFKNCLKTCNETGKIKTKDIIEILFQIDKAYKAGELTEVDAKSLDFEFRRFIKH